MQCCEWRDGDGDESYPPRHVKLIGRQRETQREQLMSHSEKRGGIDACTRSIILPTDNMMIYSRSLSEVNSACVSSSIKPLNPSNF